jgi:hypothetical protein
MERKMAQDDPLKDVLSMLSAEQLQALKTALGQSSGASGTRPKMLSEQQVNTLRNEAANYRLAQKQAAEAIGVLWNARLDLAISSGDVESIERALTRPVSRVAFYDNCNCGGGGTSYW